MSLGQGIGEMVEAVRERVEVSGHDSSWQITAGSFEAALDYAQARFGEPVVLARRDRDRLWPRVTLEVTTDPELAESAPPLDELADPVVPEPRQPEEDAAPVEDGPLPPDLEAIFAHQNLPARGARRVPRQRRSAG